MWDTNVDGPLLLGSRSFMDDTEQVVTLVQEVEEAKLDHFYSCSV